MDCRMFQALATAKIWPVFSWDHFPPIFALMVDRQLPLDELIAAGVPVTVGELERALRDGSAETSGAVDHVESRDHFL